MIGDVEKVDDVALQCTVNVLKGSAARGERPEPHYHVQERTSYTPKGASSSRTNSLEPDMTIYLKPTNNGLKPAVMLVMGDNKYSGAWSFKTACRSASQRQE